MNQLERGNGVPTQVPQEMKQEAEALRSKLLTYRLRNRFGLSLTGSPHPELSDRLNQIVFPLLSVAPNAEAKASIVKVAKRSAEKLSFEQAWSFEAEVLKAVVATDDAGDPLSVSQITKTLRLASGREFDSRLTPTLVGRTLRHRLGLSLYKTRGLVTVMPGQGETLRKLKERYL